MAGTGKNQQKKQQLDDEFDQIKNQHSGNLMDKYMVNNEEDLPGFGEIEIYDYTKDIQMLK